MTVRTRLSYLTVWPNTYVCCPRPWKIPQSLSLERSPSTVLALGAAPLSEREASANKSSILHLYFEAFSVVIGEYSKAETNSRLTSAHRFKA
jgi:hypothetical protein